MGHSHPIHSLILHRESTNIWPKRHIRRNWLESAVVSSVAPCSQALQRHSRSLLLSTTHFPCPLLWNLPEFPPLTTAPTTLSCTLTDLPSFACCLFVFISFALLANSRMETPPFSLHSFDAGLLPHLIPRNSKPTEWRTCTAVCPPNACLT